DFGSQTASGTGVAKAGGTETGIVLNGNITIKGKDVAAASPGNYTGTATFTITYDDKTENTDEEEKPEDSKDPEDPGDTELDIHNLEDGTYAVTGRMVKVDQSTLSMADNAI